MSRTSAGLLPTLLTSLLQMTQRLGQVPPAEATRLRPVHWMQRAVSCGLHLQHSRRRGWAQAAMPRLGRRQQAAGHASQWAALVRDGQAALPAPSLSAYEQGGLALAAAAAAAWRGGYPSLAAAAAVVHPPAPSASAPSRSPRHRHQRRQQTHAHQRRRPPTSARACCNGKEGTRRAICCQASTLQMMAAGQFTHRRRVLLRPRPLTDDGAVSG